MNPASIFNRMFGSKERFVAFTAAATVAIGGASLVGWIVDGGIWRTLLPGMIEMKANAALCFVLGGIALRLLRNDGANKNALAAARATAGLVAAIGLATIFEWVGGVDLGIDELVAADTTNTFALPPGRMGPVAAVSFVLLGWALFSAATFAKDRFAQWFAAASFFFFLSALAGYAFGAVGVYEYIPFGAVAINAAIAGMSLSCGIAVTTANRGPLEVFTGDDLAAVLGRRWLPMACLVPTVLGWLVLNFVALISFPAQFAYASFGTVMLVTLCVAVLLVARQIHRLDESRRTIETELRKSEARFRQLADSMPQIVWTARPDGRSDYINRRWYEYAGIPLSHEDDAWRNAVHPDDLPQIDAAWDDARRTGEFHQVEYRLMDVRFGEYRWHLEQAVADRDEAGNIARWFGSSTDIDALKRAQRALAVGERRFRMLLEGLPQLVWTCRSDGWCDYLSPQWVEYTGIPEADQLGYQWTEVVHPDDRGGLMERWHESVATGEPYDVEFRIRSASGEYRWFKTRAFRFHLDDGVEKWFGTNTDIEDQKQVESRLRASERVYRAIGESIDYGVWICASDGKNTYASPSFLNLVGLTQEQCSAFGWGDVLHPDDIQKTIAAWKQCVAEQRMWDVEHRFRGVDGKLHSVLARGVPVFNERGEVACWAGINLDITRLKEAEDALRELNATLELRVTERTEKLRESEERLRLMIEGVHDYAIYMLDPDGCVAGWNSGAERLKGYRPDEIIGRHFSCFMLPADIDAGRAQRILQTALAQGRYEEEGRRVRKDGSLFHAAVHITPLYDPARKHVGFVKVTRDITARVQAEEQRRQAVLRTRFVEQTIAAREDEQRRLARELHDGIGQSLTSLRMGLGVVERARDLPTAQAAASELRPMVVRTEDEVRRLTRNLRPAVLDDLGLVPALSRLAEEVRRSHNVQIRLDASNAAAVRLSDVVETALYRIAQEALTNVIKHAAAENIDVRLDCAPTGVQLTVADDGVGYDLGSSRSDEQGRFGIVGMRERVALLNGAFEIEGRPAGGTTILVTIPFPEDDVT